MTPIFVRNIFGQRSIKGIMADERIEELQELVVLYNRWEWDRAADAAAHELEHLMETGEDRELLEMRLERYQEWGWDRAAEEVEVKLER